MKVTIIAIDESGDKCDICGSEAYHVVESKNEIMFICVECLGLKVGKTLDIKG